MGIIKKIGLWGSVASLVGLGLALYPFFAKTESESGDRVTRGGVSVGGSNSGTIINGPSTINTNTVNSTKAEPPKFEEEFGHYEQSNRFSNFILDNQKKTVYIDAYYVPADFDEIKIINNTFDVDSFQLWAKCVEPLAPNEKPSSAKCIGTYFQLDRSGLSKDSSITYIRGTLRVQGYFSVRGCDGPHQGIMGCTLRPLNPEEVL
jgi:hypothetical protein